MRRLLDFLYRRREVAIFLLLEIASLWLLVNYNQRYNASFLNTSNEVVASVTSSSGEVSDYFKLTEINRQLSLENEYLLQQLQKLQADSAPAVDSVDQYQVIGAKVVSNTFDLAANYITIDAGKEDSVEVGMGVMSPLGIVGQIKSVTSHFATVYSLLHPKLMVSSKVNRTATKCTVQWDQESYEYASLKYIPRHIKLQQGDTITTSGFNSVFPENIMIGVIDELYLEDHMTFHEAKIKLATDFTSLYHVFVIKDKMKVEKDSLNVL